MILLVNFTIQFYKPLIYSSLKKQVWQHFYRYFLRTCNYIVVYLNVVINDQFCRTSWLFTIFFILAVTAASSSISGNYIFRGMHWKSYKNKPLHGPSWVWASTALECQSTKGWWTPIWERFSNQVCMGILFYLSIIITLLFLI